MRVDIWDQQGDSLSRQIEVTYQSRLTYLFGFVRWKEMNRSYYYLFSYPDRLHITFSITHRFNVCYTLLALCTGLIN